MSANFKQLASIVLGWILVVVGISGVVLPILPGVPLLIAGLLILERYYAWPRRSLALLRTKALKLGSVYKDRWQAVRRWLVRACGPRRKT